MAATASRFDEIGPWLLDAILALSLALIAVTPLRMELEQGSVVPGVPAPGLYGVALVHALPVAVQRHFPRAVLWWSLGVAAVALLVGPPLLFLGIAQLVILFSAAARCDRRTSLSGLLVAEALWGAAVLQQDRPDPGSWLLLGSTMVGAWLLGDGVHRRELQAASQAVTAERLRIARELHDVVAHSISVIAVQSGVGAHVIDTNPDEARRALVAIQHTSREALQEMRRLLGVLRDDDDGAVERSSSPGLAQLDDLLGEARQAGLAVDADVDLSATGRALPPLTDLTAYRVVQEALTNVRKHALAAAARVTIRGDADSVVVEVVDEGVGTAGRRSRVEDAGRGLLGMRERVAACGGVLEAGPGPAGGFRVVARLPLRSDR